MRRFGFAKLMLWLGCAFIYLPMIIMVIYSFNASKLVTVWGASRSSGTSAARQQTDDGSAWISSLEIAFYTAIAAVALGTVAALVLTRIPTSVAGPCSAAW
jgi:putrescine transport system permease protein